MRYDVGMTSRMDKRSKYATSLESSSAPGRCHQRNASRMFRRSTTLVLFLLASVPSGTNGFTARLQPPWVPGSTGGGNSPQSSLILTSGLLLKEKSKQKDKKSKSTSSSSASGDGDDAGGSVESSENDNDSSSSTGSQSPTSSRREDFPNAESTAEAARAYYAAAAADHAVRTGSTSLGGPTNSVKIGADRPRTERRMASGSTSSGSSNSSSSSALPTVRSCLKPLFQMCRPANFPIVLLFHVLGVHRALSASTLLSAQTSTVGPKLLLDTLLRPSMIVALLSIMLVTSTSMVVNDYYDARSGVDAINSSVRQQHHQRAQTHTPSGVSKKPLSDTSALSHMTHNPNKPIPNKPLVTGEVPMIVAKRFLSYLYSALMLLVAFVPGIPAQLSVIVSSMLTFWYTQHIKPRTWLKNMSCAGIIALSPLASGSAALHLLTATTSQWNGIADIAATLGRLVLTLFTGFMSREILMDITDVEGDKASGIVTVPVKYGRRFASKVAFVFSVASCVLATIGPLVQFVMHVATMSVAGGGDSAALVKIIKSMLSSSASSTIVRKLVLASIGGIMMVKRAWDVVQAEGTDDDVTDKAIAGQISVLFILASFV